MEHLRFCTKCRAIKSSNLFKQNKKSKDGWSRVCIDCFPNYGKRTRKEVKQSFIKRLVGWVW